MPSSHRPISATHALPWLLAGSIAIPLTSLLHELAHLLAYRAAGATEVVLHFNRVDGASLHHPGWVLAMGAIAGPAMTIAIVAMCCVTVRLTGPGPVAVATGLVTPYRTLVPALWLAVHAVWGRAKDANFDELNAAKVIVWPPQPIILIEIAFVAGALSWLIRAMPSERRLPHIWAAAAGGGLGIAVYWSLGALIMP